MPPQRKIRRTATLSGSFYDKSGSFADANGTHSPSATNTSFRESPGSGFSYGSGSSHRYAYSASKADADFDTHMRKDADGGDSDDEYTLTGYGELSTEEAFTLPPSPTQTIKYRYRAYRPKLARLGKKKYRSSASGLKTKSGAYHAADLASLLSPYASRSPKRDFQALLQKYRESTEGWRDSETQISPRKTYSDKTWSPASISTPSRRGVSGPARPSPLGRC